MTARFTARASLAVLFMSAAAASVQAQNYDGSGILRAGTFLQGSHVEFDVDGPAFATGTASGNGLGGGVSLGYDLRWNSWLAGVEGDISVEDGGATLAGRSYTLGYIATLRGRLGLFVHPHWLVYTTAGFSAIGAELQVGTPGTETIFKHNESLLGWNVGAGVEFDFYDVIFFGEYLYNSFDSFKATREFPPPDPTIVPLPPPTPPERYDVDTSLHLFRLGVKFKIGYDHHQYYDDPLK